MNTYDIPENWKTQPSISHFRSGVYSTSCLWEPITARTSAYDVEEILYWMSRWVRLMKWNCKLTVLTKGQSKYSCFSAFESDRNADPSYAFLRTVKNALYAEIPSPVWLKSFDIMFLKLSSLQAELNHPLTLMYLLQPPWWYMAYQLSDYQELYNNSSWVQLCKLHCLFEGLRCAGIEKIAGLPIREKEMVKIFECLRNAVVAGLGWFFLRNSQLTVIPLPCYSTDERGRLHSLNGPAIVWDHELNLAGCHGTAYSTEIPDQGRSAKQFWYRGVRVSERIIFQPETLTAQDIKSESNQEVRRVMTERYGEWKVMNDSDRLIIEAGIIRGRNN